MSKVMLVLIRQQISHYEIVLQKHCDYCEKQTIMLAEKGASGVKKMKNRHEQNFEGEANNMQLDKEDTQRRN